MTIDKSLISKLEKLAKLHLDDAEKTILADDLNNILQMVEKLQNVDTEGIEPLIYISNEVNRLRKDEIKGQVSRDNALKNAPEQDGTYFKVPKVINL